MSVKKTFGKFGQWTGEVFGTIEGTKFDDDFNAYEKFVDALDDTITKIIKHCDEFLMPNSAARTKLKMMGSPYIHPESEFGDALGKATVVLNMTDVCNGLTTGLKFISEAEKFIGEKHTELETGASSGFLKPLQDIQNIDIKEINASRKKLDSRRLDYDAKKRNQSKISKKEPAQAVKIEEEFRIAEMKFEESKNTTFELMNRLVLREYEILSYFEKFIELQYIYHDFSVSTLHKAKSQVAEYVEGSRSNCRGYDTSAYIRGSSSNSSQKNGVESYGMSETMPGGMIDHSKDGAKYVTALYAFDGENSDELTFPAGATIAVIERINEDWYKGVYMGCTGIFPANYVS